MHDDIFVITRLREAILVCFGEGHETAVVELNINVMKKILSEGLFAIEAKGRWKDKEVYFIPHKTYREDYFTVHGEAEAPSSLPENAQSLH